MGPRQIILPPPDSVDHGKLQEGEEDETGAGQEPNVNEFHIVHLQNKTKTPEMLMLKYVGDLGQLIGARVPGESDHGEPGGRPQSGPAGHGVGIQPEGDPAHADQEDGGDVVLQVVLPCLPPHDEVDKQRAVVPTQLPAVAVS